jgi:hypothetical protein
MWKNLNQKRILKLEKKHNLPDWLKSRSAIEQKISNTAESATIFSIKDLVVPEFDHKDIREFFSRSYRIRYKAEQDRAAMLAMVPFCRDLMKLISKRLLDF